MQRYPAAFGSRRIPLVLGIDKDILNEIDCDAHALSITLRHWCGHIAYATAVAKGTHRHGLDGSPVAKLTEAERAEARQRLNAGFKPRKPGEAGKV